MQHLMCPGDLHHAATCFVQRAHHGSLASLLVILSGFPCCLHHTPPTETDGPPGAVAIGRAGLAVGYARAVIVTDACNARVMQAACAGTGVEVESFSAAAKDPEDDQRLEALRETASLWVACERAGPARDGRFYTMRGIDMNAQQPLVCPYLHSLVENRGDDTPFIGIGDGGNELGMGKVYDQIVEHIPDGDKIGCVIAADHLIAASVSNWGGYALAAAAAVIKAPTQEEVPDWVARCLPTEQEEVDLLERCVAQGCRDGVTGKCESTVDGMPLERSLQCLEELRQAALGLKTESEQADSSTY